MATLIGGLFASSAANYLGCMACSCFAKLVDMTLSQAARFGHLLVVLTTFAFAIILGQSFPDYIDGYTYYSKVDLTGDCNENFLNNCIYRQLIYRASFSLVIVFVFVGLLSYISDIANKGFWLLKFGAAIGIFIAFWWVDNAFFSGWAEVARVVSFFWLIIQGLLLVDFSHDAHELLMGSSEESANKPESDSSPYISYLVFSFVAFFAAMLGIVFLFLDYTGCGLGMFFVIFTLIMGVLTTFISLLERIGRGLLTPCVCFAYSVFMCWYALLSDHDQTCNPTANSIRGATNVGIIVVAVVTVVILFYCVINGTRILNVFDTQGEGVLASYNNPDYNKKKSFLDVILDQPTNNSPQSQTVANEGGGTNTTIVIQNQPAAGGGDPNDPLAHSGTPAERGFFHIVMVLVVSYAAMILTNWGTSDGASVAEANHSISNESLWLKIVSQWVFLILYCRILQVAYENSLE